MMQRTRTYDVLILFDFFFYSWGDNGKGAKNFHETFNAGGHARMDLSVNLCKIEFCALPLDTHNTISCVEKIYVLGC